MLKTLLRPKILKQLKRFFAISDPVPLPVNSLENSINLFEKYAASHLEKIDYLELCQRGKNFTNSDEARKLQNLLEQRATSSPQKNWLFDYWLQFAYLTYRAPLIINSNPNVRLPIKRFNSDSEWLMHAAKVIQGVLRYKNLIEDNKLKTDIFPDGTAMCMNQFYSMLSNCRIPAPFEDKLIRRLSTPKIASKSDFICVSFNNQFYILKVYDGSTPLSLLQLFHCLSNLVAKGSTCTEFPIGILTCLPRDDLYQVYQQLCIDSQNRNNFDVIFNSIFLLNLDFEAGIESVQETSSEDGIITNSDEVKNAYNGLHGAFNPSKRVTTRDPQNVANRWFDKTIQIHVSRDGSFGLNFEHSPMDGPAIIALVDSILENTDSSPQGFETTEYCKVPTNSIIPLNFNSPPLFQQELERAFDLTNNLIESMQGTYGKFVSISKQKIKSLGVSPDAFMQVGMQLAYNSLHPDQLPPPTYESGSLRRFINGRTECIRSCSPHTVEFTQMMRNSTDKLAQRSALIEACVAHSKYTKIAMNAEAFDRHFLGLKAIAMETGLHKETAIKSFLFDPRLASLSDFRISSSQISSNWDISVLFGPTSPDGYGFCYNAQNNQFIICCSSFQKSNKTLHPDYFVRAVGSSLMEMQRLFE